MFIKRLQKTLMKICNYYIFIRVFYIFTIRFERPRRFPYLQQINNQNFKANQEAFHM